jgi:hypothetical protein
MDLVRNITKKGLPVILAAGNRGPDMFNIYSTIPGTLSVGSVNASGDISPWSADNSMVKGWARGEFEVRTVDGGYDITEDGKVDVVMFEVSNKPVSSRVQKPRLGTSLAAPTLLGELAEKGAISARDEGVQTKP